MRLSLEPSCLSVSRARWHNRSAWVGKPASPCRRCGRCSTAPMHCSGTIWRKSVLRDPPNGSTQPSLASRHFTSAVSPRWRFSKVRSPELPGQCQAAAGLSLGEYTALAFAGAVDFESGLQLVQRRGEAMQAAADAVPSGMVSLLGLELNVIDRLCNEAVLREKCCKSPIIFVREISSFRDTKRLVSAWRTWR